MKMSNKSVEGYSLFF